MTCQRCERPAAAAYLCQVCARDLAGHLADMPGLFELLEDFLLPPRRPGARGARQVWAPAPLDLDIVDMRTEMARQLTSWRDALYDALKWDPPAPVTSLADRVKSAVDALAVNALWIVSSWPAAGDCAQEIGDLHRDATSVVGPREYGVRMGNCPTVKDGVLCGAPLKMPPGGTVAACRWCGSTYPPATWAALRMAQDAISPAASPEAPEARPLAALGTTR